MNIVQENQDKLHAIIKVELNPEDYSEQVAAEMKSLQRKVQMPGFRPGKVPTALMQKMYGRNVLIQEVNKILHESLENHIRDNKIEILGSPLPKMDDSLVIDWDNQKDFTFYYQIGLAPEVNIALSKDISMDYHQIIVADDTIDSFALELRNRNGQMISPEISEVTDVLNGEFVELESADTPKAEGYKHTSSIFIKYIKNEDAQKKLCGLTVGDSVELDVISSVGDEAEAARILGIKKEDLANYSPLFRFTVDKISRLEPAVLDEEFYKKAFPEAAIEDEVGFRAELEKIISKQYQMDVDKHFRNEVMKKLLEIAQLPLPEEFLKDWLQVSGKELLTKEQAETEFAKLADPFRWQLIENHILDAYQVSVTDDEIKEYLSDYYRQQLKQYGMDVSDQSMVDGFVKRILQNQDEVKKVSEDLFNQKLLALFKEKLSLNVIDITMDDFSKLVVEKYRAEIPQ